jgi:hypothetical protein
MVWSALALFVSTIPMVQTSLIRRTIQSNVACSSDFSWADNQQGLNPCTVAAFVDAACQGDGDMLCFMS